MRNIDERVYWNNVREFAFVGTSALQCRLKKNSRLIPENVY